MDADDPRHGTRKQTWDTVPGCPCNTCEKVRAYRRRVYKERRLGRPRRVPVTLVAQHIRRLLRDGWTQREIAETAGVGQGTISETLRGIYKQMTVENAAAIMGVTGHPAPLMVPAHGTRRRLQALVAMGWLAKEVTAAAGLAPNFLADLCHRQQPTVAASTAAAVEATYDRLSMTIPEQTPHRRRSKTLAAKRGWVPPLCWDNIEDPAEMPKGTHETTRTKGRPRTEVDSVIVDKLLALERVESTPAEKCEAMRRWLADGKTERSLCQAHNWHDGRYTPEEVA